MDAQAHAIRDASICDAEVIAEADLDAEASHALLARVRQGDDRALELLYGRYLIPLTRWARGRLPYGARDLMQTDDLIQETLLRTMRGVAAFDPEHSGAFLAYLRRAVLNRIRDELRRVGRRPALDGSLDKEIDPHPSPFEAAIGRETLARYECALDTLTEDAREAVLARVELGLSFAQIAELFGKKSADAARMMVSRALVRLAEAMADG